MPVGPVTQGPKVQKTAFDLQRGGRSPNDGTEWAGEEGANPNSLYDSGDASSPNRFNQFNEKKAKPKKGKPFRRLIDDILDEQGFDCKVCNLHFTTMETFNRHCEPSKSEGALPREMPCEMAKRLFAEKTAGEKAHMLDPNAVANAVADALKPTLLSVVDALRGLTAIIKGAPEAPPAEPEPKGPTWSNPAAAVETKKPKAKKEGKKRAGSRVVRGAAQAGGSKPVGPVESKPAALADPPDESPAPELSC